MSVALDRVTITLEVNLDQLNNHLGNTPNVTASEAIKELVDTALSVYYCYYEGYEPTGIDYVILESQELEKSDVL